MSLERDLYEAGWRYCARCGTRRPQAALTAGECGDRAWCDKAMPSCDVCGKGVQQPERAGRPRKRHAACRTQAAKLRAAGVLP